LWNCREPSCDGAVEYCKSRWCSTPWRDSTRRQPRTAHKERRPPAGTRSRRELGVDLGCGGSQAPFHVSRNHKPNRLPGTRKLSCDCNFTANCHGQLSRKIHRSYPIDASQGVGALAPTSKDMQNRALAPEEILLFLSWPFIRWPPASFPRSP